jgi:periplasmic protein CpxP/Spy
MVKSQRKSMKRNLLALVPVIASLGLAIAPPSLVLSQPGSPTSVEFDRENRLNLTPEQKAQIQSIQEAKREQMLGILTNEQKDKLKAGVQNGQRPPQVFASLNLTDDQKEQMKELMTAAKNEISQVLTPEQLQKLEEMRPNKKGRMPSPN